MMDPEQLLERQIPERYVAGRLTAEEAADFEEYLLEHPEFFEKVEAARQLKLGLDTLSARGTLDSLLHTRPAPHTYWLIAAGLAIAVMGAIFVAMRPPARIVAATLADLAAPVREQKIAGEFMLVRTRGNPVAIQIPPAAAPLQIRIGPFVATDQEYSVALECNGKAESVNHLRTDADGMIVVFLDPTRFAPGACDFRTHSSAGEDQLFPVQFFR